MNPINEYKLTPQELAYYRSLTPPKRVKESELAVTAPRSNRGKKYDRYVNQGWSVK